MNAFRIVAIICFVAVVAIFAINYHYKSWHIGVTYTNGVLLFTGYTCLIIDYQNRKKTK